jgi:hypothetical protein
MIADDLSKAQIAEDEIGRIHAAGLSGGYCYYERSGDGGATKQVFADGYTWRLVSQDTVDDEAPAIEVTASGQVLVALTQGGQVRVYGSELDGWSFDIIGAVE